VSLRRQRQRRQGLRQRQRQQPSSLDLSVDFVLRYPPAICSESCETLYIYSDAQRGCWALRLLAPDLDTRVDKRHLSSHSLCAQFLNKIKFSRSSSSIKFAERHRLRKSPTYPV
jgi:hypothetical protein